MELKVEGMTCGGCVGSVKRILARQLEVDQEAVIVELDEGRATVPDDTDAATLEQAFEKLAAAGFPARPA